MDDQARQLGLEVGILQGEGFNHRVYTKNEPCAHDRLHVYLEGDGRAWLPGDRVALDPTPPRSCLLPLMALDPAPAVYLGRPCYHGFATDNLCHPRLWTQGRYGEEVIRSMTSVFRRFLGDHQNCRPVLIGFSGGGTLAMLMAAKLGNKVQGIVTLAGNLNLSAWTRLHGYSPLQNSMDPSSLPPLPAAIFQLHIGGGMDDNIPFMLIAGEAGRHSNARVLLVPGQAHTCPDTDVWRGVLTGIAILEQNKMIGSAKNGSRVRLK